MAKRQNDSYSIKDLMDAFISENNLTRGFVKINAQEAWVKIMGNGVNSYTERVELKGKTLIVRLTSSVLREELSHGKQKIIEMMNRELGNNSITNITLR
ncbi:DUF721 domain-containing protein [Aureivirga sp. CE67]|uniref:DUF721 domain-containing protein n=1 Tax=Aureivirga sp. CE67 TaxID=1788983 RepID=UPI0018CA6209|nr:DUF721 domain-containing protein [Aureivirga sp. CE67]